VRNELLKHELFIFYLEKSNAEQTHDMKIANRCFENVTQFGYFGTTIANQNLIHEEIKRD
jgi:hypothetical protein